MQHLMTLKALGAAALGFGMALSAAAAPSPETFTVAFSFTPDAPVEQTYADFRETARRACRDTIDDIRLTPQFQRARRLCEAQLIEDAVMQSGLDRLVALHARETAPDR